MAFTGAAAYGPHRRERPFGGTHAISGDVPAGITVEIEGGDFLRASANWTNAGTIALNGLQGTLTTQDGDNTTTETLTNTGTIVAGGPDGVRTLGGDIINQGIVRSDHPNLVIANVDGGRTSTLTNTGTVSATAGNRLLVDNGALVQNAGATTAGQARSTSAPAGGCRCPAARSRTTSTSMSSAAAGTVAATSRGGAGVRRRLGAGARSASPATSAAATPSRVRPGRHHRRTRDGRLVAAADWTNAGTLRLSGSNAGVFTENGAPTDVETLTNTGTIITSGTGDARTLGGDLANQGTVRHGTPTRSSPVPTAIGRASSPTPGRWGRRSATASTSTRPTSRWRSAGRSPARARST